MSFSIKTREDDGVVIVDMTGRMSFPDPHIRPLLFELLETGRRSFVLNMSGVLYCDSYGLHDLVTAYTMVKKQGGKVNILRPIPNVKKTIELTLKGVFEILEDENAAVQAAKV